MKLFDFLSSLFSQSFSFLSPNLIIDQLFQRFQSALKALILLTVCTAMSCVTLAYLIARFLDQLDAGEFVITRSIIWRGSETMPSSSRGTMRDSAGSP